MVWCGIILISVSIPVFAAGTGNATDVSFEYKVQEDPYLTFAYPAGMTLTVTSADGRNTYNLINDKKHPVTYLFTSGENSEWAPLDEAMLADYGRNALTSAIGDISGRNLTEGKSLYLGDANLSSYFTSYLDTDTRELFYTLTLSDSDSVISGVLTEPVVLLDSEFGDFTIKSLLSLTPRTSEEGFVLELAGNDKSIGETINATASGSPDKAIAYDPYYGLYYDTDTRYYYLPQYGVFYDPTTGDYYYPEQFGSYGSDYFVDYSGTYDPYGDYSGYYDNLYSGYGGYDASGIISDAYNYRQDTYDAANAMWDDYIRGDTYYGTDDSGYLDPIDTIQEYQDYGLSE